MVEYRDIERAILDVIATILLPPVTFILWLVDRISHTSE